MNISNIYIEPSGRLPVAHGAGHWPPTWLQDNCGKVDTASAVSTGEHLLAVVSADTNEEQNASAVQPAVEVVDPINDPTEVEPDLNDWL